MKKLSELTLGSYVITLLDSDETQLKKLMAMGLNVGLRLRVLKNRSGDVVIGLQNARLGLGENTSRLIYCQP